MAFLPFLFTNGWQAFGAHRLRSIYLWLAIGLVVLFSILAFASRFFLKHPPWIFWFVIDILWALPYGL